MPPAAILRAHKRLVISWYVEGLFWHVKVDSDDNEQVLRDAKLMTGVGEVIVYVHRTRREGSEQMMVRPEPKVVKEVSEKALKGQAISHSVT